MVLVDTSVWVEALRRPARLHLNEIVHFDDVVTCLPVVPEVLQGFDDERAFLLAREAMYALPIVESPMSSAVIDETVDLFRRASRAGLTIRCGVDCLIAACALRNDLSVLHHDRDFGKLGRVSALRARHV